MKFRIKRTGEIKTAYSIEAREERVYIKFTEKGKEYAYNKDNIDVLEDEHKAVQDCPFIVYQLEKQCYKCRKVTSVFTYMIFDDGTDQDVVYPWDKERLLKNQNIMAHLQDPSIEYYGLKIVGDDEKLDRILMGRFPEKIQVKYSKTQGRSYPMNLCDHCGAVQGWNFIYRQVNEMIQEMRKIEILV